MFVLNVGMCSSQQKVLDSLIGQLPEASRQIIQNPIYRFQMIYTKIEYLSDNRIQFTDYYYQYSDTLYHYPASMVKLPASVVAMKKIESFHNDSIHLDSPLLMDSLFCQPALVQDTVGLPAYPHLRKWIKRMMLISDNEAYTHTYDFINCKTFHQWLKEWHFDKAKISHKFISKCVNDSTFYTPTVYILNAQKDTIFVQYQDSACHFDRNDKNYFVGYIIQKKKKGKRIIRQKVPKSFAHHNDWPLDYSHQLVKYLIFDEYMGILNLSPAHRDSLIKYMGSYPREYPEIFYHTAINPRDYYDSWKKFFIYGGKYSKIDADTLRSINIIGRAYGFLSETAYIIDFKNNIDFIISASIYANPDDVMNGRYSYDIGYLIFYQISRLIYEYEKLNSHKPASTFQYYEKIFQTH